MQTKLTLRMEDSLVESAKKEALRRGDCDAEHAGFS